MDSWKYSKYNGSNSIQSGTATFADAFDGSEERLKEVKTVLFQYFQKKMDERLDELWDTGVLDQKKLDELRTKHLRTELKK